MQSFSKIQIVLTVLVLAGVVWLVVTTKGQQNNPSSSTTPAGQKSENWSSVKVSEEKIEDNSGPYRISAAYPVTASATITGSFKSFVQEQIDQFKEDTSWAADDPSSAQAQELTLSVTYVEDKTAHADNYTFSVESYTGGAHGLQATKTFSFSETGIPVTLDTLFTNGVEGLKTVVPFVQTELKKREFADPKWITEGTMPTTDNYQNFIITDTGIQFIFDPYQVAPYSSGIQRVTVPLSVFKSIANTEVFPKE